MNFLRNFFACDLAIDLGTVNTRIFAPGRGVVLDEPSAIAVHKYTDEVICTGADAHGMLGREPRDTVVHRPVSRGNIDDLKAAKRMLSAFLNRAQGGRPRRARLAIGVTGSSTMVERLSALDAARDLKASGVDLIDQGLAAGLGACAGGEVGLAHLIVDIGGGKTGLAIVSSGKIISSSSLPSAGLALDEAIRHYVRAKYLISIGEHMSEELKKELGAAHPVAAGGLPEGGRRMEVVGKDLSSGLAKAVDIRPAEVREAMEPVLAEIVAGARRAVEESGPDVTADLYHTGVILTGGGARLKGLVERLRSELRLHVALADDPRAAVALGLGRLLADPQRLRRVSMRQDAPAWQVSGELVAS